MLKLETEVYGKIEIPKSMLKREQWQESLE